MTPIRTRRDGSIDTGFYMARGRRLRSEQAHGMLGRSPADTPQPERRRFARLWRTDLA